MKSHRMLASSLLLVTLATGALAHDFWLEPTRWSPAGAGLIGVEVIVGHDGKRDVFPRDDARIERFVVSGPAAEGEARTLDPVPGARGRAPAGYLRLDQPGVHVVAYHGKPTALEMEPAKFEAYLLEEGLESVVEERERRGEGTAPGRETFARCAKMLVRVGEEAGPGFDQRIGLPLELVPLDDPFELKGRARFNVRILWRNAPIAGLLVEAEPLVDGGDLRLRARSDADGSVVFELPEGLEWSGKWLVTAVHMQRAEDGVDHDWESHWASMTFEIGVDSNADSNRRESVTHPAGGAPRTR